MRPIALLAAALTLVASSALAQAPLAFADVDADGNGELSFAELSAVWPGITEDEFAQADLDGSGGLSPHEVDALQPSTLGSPSGQ